MEEICPVCNGFKEIKQYCLQCRRYLEDYGRLMDYYDDYSPYMSIDQLKLEDGLMSDFAEGTCPHLLLCHHCGFTEIVMINK
ncbi:hypothetical protein J9303_09080 [Bacillaceae bacterium Marseille-Q3522]|nr:hypothetical protein [Bacillaceae bacterium Marseille-Q3522]